MDARSLRVAGFPGWTHLIATLAFPGWIIGTEAHLYGIELRYDWWQGFGDLMPWVIAAVVLTVLPPAVAIEVWAVVQCRRRWATRPPVVFYVLVAGFASFLPTGLRFSGDVSPTPMEMVTLSLATYGIVVGAQLLCAYVACWLWTRRTEHTGARA